MRDYAKTPTRYERIETFVGEALFCIALVGGAAVFAIYMLDNARRADAAVAANPAPLPCQMTSATTGHCPD